MMQPWSWDCNDTDDSDCDTAAQPPHWATAAAHDDAQRSRLSEQLRLLHEFEQQQQHQQRQQRQNNTATAGPSSLKRSSSVIELSPLGRQRGAPSPPALGSSSQPIFIDTDEQLALALHKQLNGPVPVGDDAESTDATARQALDRLRKQEAEDAELARMLHIEEEMMLHGHASQQTGLGASSSQLGSAIPGRGRQMPTSPHRLPYVDETGVFVDPRPGFSFGEDGSDGLSASDLSQADYPANKPWTRKADMHFKAPSFDLIDLDAADAGSSSSPPAWPGDLNGPRDQMRLSEYGAPERPLSAQESQKNLRELLENVQHVMDVTPPEKRPATPQQLSIDLLEHQKLGLEWMLKMERGSNLGGILADDMGLGKTVQSIALIVSNPPPPQERLPTLIVAPVSLVMQWIQELHDKTKQGTLSVYMFYGQKRNKDPEFLKKFDVIVTSYSILALDWPAPKHEKRRHTYPRQGSDDDEPDPEYPRTSRESLGPLFKLMFHRVILDEAHFIKNKATRSAQAACHLDTKYRWCLTGTPIQNSITELYSLIKFLQIKPYCDWSLFRSKIKDPMKRGYHKRVMERVHALMKAICLRRSKKSMLDGKPIIVLPERIVEIDTVRLSEPEREFYDSLEKRQRLQFNAYLREGTVMKNYTNILVLLLRLRQACCHPLLIAHDLEQVGPSGSPQSRHDRMQDMIRTMDDKVVKRLLDREDDQECPICYDAFQQPVFIPACGHLFCKECVISYIGNADGNARVSGKGKEPRLEVGGDDELEAMQAKTMQWITSAKVERALQLLEESRNNHPGEKTIVFSQFTKLLDLLESPLQQRNFKFVRYNGSMSAPERDAAVTQLRQDPETSVILVSLKCGSLGLNLVAANRVILMDLWWNPAVENQAIDRVHRFGQKRDVIVHRLTVADTVEDRIMTLQEKKRNLADQALGEGSAEGMHNMRLDLGDLMMLFGVDE
ncbi:hypothetical protein HK105_202053 [Polyrhizophydium stewartii]|uniref:Uncharacterized protein n=1 Tax=Polyrhizophydium stewartii TaxID=2732419 RepID=A0ABR4NF25_9FUNG